MVQSSEESPKHVGIGYRTILDVHGDDAIAIAERNVRNWMNDKFRLRGARSWNGRERFAPRDGFVVEVVNSGRGRGSGVKARLYRVTDRNPGGTFVVLIAAGEENAGRGHIVVSAGLMGASETTAIDEVSAPGIVSRILQDAAIRDGSQRLTSAPTTVGSTQLRLLRTAILDSARKGMVVVTASIAPAFDGVWAKISRSLIRESIGISNLFIVPADFVADVNRGLPPSHQIQPGQVRTFAPRVDIEDRNDGLRHRILSVATLNRSTRDGRVGDILAHVHARGPRALFLARPLPDNVRETLQVLERAELVQQRDQTVVTRLDERRRRAMRRIAEATHLIDAPDPAGEETELLPQVPDEATRLASGLDTPVKPVVGAVENRDASTATKFWARFLAFANKWLGHAPTDHQVLDDLDAFIESRQVEVEVAEEQIDDAITEYESTRRRVEALEDQNEMAQLEALEAQEELSFLRDTVAWQWRRLGELKNAEVYEPDVLWASAPENVLDLVELLHAGNESRSQVFARVECTVDSEDGAVTELARYDRAGTYARAFWDHVRVLYDYAELKCAGGFDGNVHQYLTSDIPGFKVPPKQHAGRESDSVMNNRTWAAERIRPVPTCVNEDGEAMMGAHFRPSHHDTFAPRMHYYDDTAPGGTGKIYIGYIGRHLTNTQT